MNDNSPNFRISNFYTAAFLFAQGMELVGIDNSNHRRAEFVFTNPAKCEPLVRSYSFAKDGSPEALVDARKFATAIKLLKEKLYQEKANQ